MSKGMMNRSSFIGIELALINLKIELINSDEVHVAELIMYY